MGLDEFERAHAARSANDRARAIDAQALAVGVGLTAESGGSLTHEINSTLADFSLYASGSGKDPEPLTEVPAPPAEVARFLANHDAALRTLEDEVLKPGEIVFEGKGPGTFQFNPSWTLRVLSTLIRADALAHGGDKDRSNRALEAVWKLNVLRGHAHFVFQMVAMAIDGEVCRTLRRLPSPAAAWQDRVVSHDYLRSALASLEGEVLLPSSALSPVRGWPTGSLLGCGSAIGRLLEAPYDRLCMANYSDRMRRAIARLRRADPCLPPPQPEPAPAWNELVRNVGPGFAESAFEGAAWASLELEASRMVLAVRAAPGRALAQGRMASNVCPGLSWEIDRVSPTTLSLSPSRTLPCQSSKPARCTFPVELGVPATLGAR
jgi:hypothetical protein